MNINREYFFVFWEVDVADDLHGVKVIHIEEKKRERVTGT